MENYYNGITESAAALSNAEKTEYDDEYILKCLMEGITREDLAVKLNHKNYRTLDMYMRRRGYFWDSERQIYAKKINSNTNINYEPENFGKAEKIISLFNAGFEPLDIAKKVGMADHRAMAAYMKSKGYTWSHEKHNYIFFKGELTPREGIQFKETLEDCHSLGNSHSLENSTEAKTSTQNELEKLETLLPMLEMISKNKEKLAELLCTNSKSTLPRYSVGGITITKSLCMSHSLSQLVKEFSKEKNISQREIFEISIIEFLKKYGYENEINALFSS
ncbi:hypothetical protein HBE96_21205 [Clostridium sp. P21]|uniref:Uncharacterized protein n=1 Tax=Clostridium muellerianum TaxID=2716538 RepID=A0A7Y0EKK6_9CLOT|nr:hypothetical protein [Clostridium muellerianum]NMM65106.1 hypothetical protein [Clostridium muellerianum]